MLPTKNQELSLSSAVSFFFFALLLYLKLVDHYLHLNILGDTYDQNGKLLFKNQLTTFIVGAGNFGGKSKASDNVIPAISAPDRAADAEVKYSTSVDQAALYR